MLKTMQNDDTYNWVTRFHEITCDNLPYYPDEESLYILSFFLQSQHTKEKLHMPPFQAIVQLWHK